MTEAQTLAFCVAAITLVVLIWQRNRLLDFTCTAVFFISYLIFVLMGVLAAPWLIDDYLLRSYSYLDWLLITERDLMRTIVVVAGGLGLVLLGNIIMDLGRLAATRQPRSTWGFLVHRPERFSPGRRRVRLRLISVVSLGLAGLYLWTKRGVVLSGISSIYLNADVASYYSSRSEVAELGLIYYLLIFDVLPFLSVMAWMLYRYRRTVRNVLWAWLMVGSTSFLLLSTFQKRPFIFFLLCLVLAHFVSELYMGRLRLKVPRIFPTAPIYWLTRVPWLKVILALGVLFAILVWLYSASTNIVATSGSVGQALLTLTMVSLDRIFGRLSVMPMLYVHYFPAVSPHYGFTNVGKLMDLLGGQYFPDTVVVLRYFTGLDKGGGAIGAVVDFYAAFGWWGWGICCLALGVFLNILDHWLSSLSATILNRTFYIFMLVFAYYLSQASVARSLSSYGGIVFWLIWFVMSVTLTYRPQGSRGTATQSNSTQTSQV